MYTLEVRKSKSGKWYWRIVHQNKKILAVSEMYSSKQKAIDTASNLNEIVARPEKINLVIEE